MHTSLEDERISCTGQPTRQRFAPFHRNRAVEPDSLNQRNQLAWPHRRRGLASDGVRYAGARSSVGRWFRIATKLRLEWYGGMVVLLQQHSKHPRELVITPKAATSHLINPSPFNSPVLFCITAELIFSVVWSPCVHSRKQRTKALTLAHAQTILYTSN